MEPFKIIPADLDCSRILEHTKQLEFLQSRSYDRGGQRHERSTTEAKIWDPAIDELVFKCVSGLIMTYAQANPGLEITNDEGYWIVKYEVGGDFKIHQDQGPYHPTRCVSLVLYLNDDFEGGETDFPEIPRTVKPKQGSALLFPSNFTYPHRVFPVTKGTKYSLVTWFHLRGITDLEVGR